MDTGTLHSNIAMLLAAVCMLLSVQSTGAQYTNSTGVPGWGIALLTMMSVMAALALGFLLVIPCWCRSTKGDRQEGISFYSPHGIFSGSDCQIACQSGCQQACRPACQPARRPVPQPVCLPACEPVCEPACEPTCEPACQGACEPACGPTCEPVCKSICESDSQSDCEPQC